MPPAKPRNEQPAGEFNILEAMANLTLLEQHARATRENLIMVCELKASAATASNLVEAGTDVLRRIQNGNQATVNAAPAEVIQAQIDAHQEVFDKSLLNATTAAKRLLRQFGMTT